MIPVKIPKDVLDLFPMWQYNCPNCPDSKVLSEKVHHCVKCGAEFNEEKWRVPPRFLKNSKAMSDYAHKVLAPKLSPEQRELLFKYFTVLFSDGFDDGTFDAWSTVVGSPTVVTAQKHHGTHSMYVTGSGPDFVYSGHGAQLIINARVYLRLNSAIPNYTRWCFLQFNKGAVPICRLNIYQTTGPTYHLYMERWFPIWGAVGTVPIAMVPGEWHCYEMGFVRDAVNGEYRAYFNNAELMNQTGLDTSGVSDCEQVYCGNATTTVVDFHEDCVVIADVHIGPEPETQTLTLTSTEGGKTFPSSGSYSYAKDSSKEVTAIPDSGYVFDHWELNDLNVSTKLSYVVTMNTDHRLRAFFVLSPVGTLSLRALADSEEVTALVKVVHAITGEVIGTDETEFDLDLPPGTYSLSASYKDQIKTDDVTITAGVTSTVTFRFTKMHTLIIVSDPSPIDFTLDGEAFETPRTLDKRSGSYEIVFPSSWFVGVDEYLFTQWEDGSVNPTRTVTIGSPQAVNLTATYRLKQIEGTGPITQREHKDNLKQVLGNEKDISEDNPLPTIETTPTEVLEGQVTLTGTAQQLPDEPCLAVTFENPINNAVVSIGHDDTVTLLNGYRLQPGATKSYDIDNVNRFWVSGTATSRLI
ncbi:hypothetical protein ES703_80408 [subsurface metagenome]